MGKKDTGKLMRGLDKEYLKRFADSKWFKFYQKHEEELFLGIRNNYVNIYYKGMNIAKIQGKFNNATIADRYRYKDYKKKNEYHAITYDDFEEIYEETIKPEVEKHIEKNKLWEKETQQILILRNNANCKKNKSNWVCIDMESIRQRQNKKDNQGKSFGRFDVVAVNKENYKVALIELKVGQGAIGGESGLLKHAKDWEDVKKRNLFSKDRNGGENCLKNEIVEIINNKYFLDNSYPIKGCSKEDFEHIEPEFYFLICSGDMTIDEIKNQVRKYLWSAEKCKKYNIKQVSDKYNVEKNIGYDISKKGAGPLYCEFLFAEGARENIKITDIIDDEYERNIEE